MSDMPSLLKSPVPMACQNLPGLGRTAEATIELPFISQICGLPSSFWNRMSALPTALKSPALMACQDTPGLPAVAVLTTDVPFICQTAVAPSVFWNRRSELPSSLKSAAENTREAEHVVASVTVLVGVVLVVRDIF